MSAAWALCGKADMGQAARHPRFMSTPPSKPFGKVIGNAVRIGAISVVYRSKNYHQRERGRVTIHAQRRNVMLKSALLVTTGIVIGAGAISALNAQSSTPYFNVSAINVTDKDGYEASGVDKVRDAIKANGGKLIAGGYNKAVAIDSDVQPTNRFLIFMYPNKEASDKAWEATKPWLDKVKGKYTDRVRIFGVEGVEQK
jgi:hypothetical protein